MQFLIGFLGKILAAVVAYSPAKVRQFLGDFFGVLWFDVFRIRRRVALENLRLAFPEKSEGEIVHIGRDSLRNMGQTLVDFAQFPFLTANKLDQFMEFQGFENVNEALKRKKGVLFLSMHIGNGDLGVTGCSIRGLKVHLISKRFKSKWLDDLWFGMRANHGTKFVSPEKSSFTILRALGQNEIVIFVLDQFMGPPVGVRTKFFGRETGTAMGLALVHLRTNAPLVVSYTYRRPDNKLVVVFEKELSIADFGLDPQSPDRAQTISMLTQKYTDKIEEIVRRHPGQWMWIHRRWKDFVEGPKV